MMNADIVLSDQEKKAIAALKREAKNWPESLWLFSASGSLTVMKNNANGQRVELGTGGYDQKFAVVRINIPNDGGDW